MFMTEWTVGAGVGFAQARALREAVRVREQGISPEQEFDAMDAVAAHLFVCTDAGEPIAAGRMYPCPEHDAVRIDRLVVAPAFRGKLYDDLLLRVADAFFRNRSIRGRSGAGAAHRIWVPARRIAANGARHCTFCAVQRRDLGQRLQTRWA